MIQNRSLTDTTFDILQIAILGTLESPPFVELKPFVCASPCSQCFILTQRTQILEQGFSTLIKRMPDNYEHKAGRMGKIRNSLQIFGTILTITVSQTHSSNNMRLIEQNW